MGVYTTARPVRRWRATNENASSFASKIPTITEPINDGVINLTDMNNTVAKRLILWPFLLGGDGDVSSIRIIGWEQALLDGSRTLWVPFILAEFSCTASTCVGVAGSAVLNTERFCDTITPVAARIEDQVLGAGTAVHSRVEILSPANDTPAHILMNIDGVQKLEITSDQTGGTATFNTLYRLLDEE